ncbi:hypothetical protein [Phormidesmis priestleyi]
MPETEYWEFLLQKEGDRSWLPLDSSDVEILEGRYRIVARSHRKNSNVEVRIIHQATDEIPPKRRTQKRSHRTNQDGLVVVIPFTSLKPGIWELNCSGDLMSDLMGNGWQAAIQLHVVPRDSEEDADDWEPDWEMPSEEAAVEPAETDSSEDSPPQAKLAPVTGSSVDRLLQIAEQMSEQTAESSESIVQILPPLQITLTQETFVAHRGQRLTLTGQIAPVEAISTGLMLSLAELKASLRDPQSSDVWLETCELILNQPLPMPLAFELALPDKFKARLLLGEFTIYDLSQDSQAPSVLANQSFTLTADASDLLDSVSEEMAPDEEALEQALEASANPPKPAPQASQLNLSFLNFVDTPKTQSFEFKPIAAQPLPPQIYSSPSQEGKKSLDLPSFSSPANQLEPDPALDDLPGDLPDDLLEAELTQLELAIDPEEPSLSEQSALPPEDISLRSAEANISLKSPVQSAFQALNLQDRFFSRLNSLASDAELSEELKAAANPFVVSDDSALVETESIEEPSAISKSEEEPSEEEPSEEEPPVDPDLLSQEVVVDDEPGESAFSPKQKAQPVANPLLLPEEEPVPTPILEVTTEEFIAGQPILVKAKLPNLLPKFYVKLWINDRQTRALLDGPRWLVDFNPNGLGDLEASTQLTVPFGSLEIQLEAIAVEVSTQRESHKVVIDRSVVPPNLPDLSLDDFEV